MSRNVITQGIVLKTTRIGEIHKGLTLLTKDRGIISAIAHGAWKMKSRLRAFTQLFSVLKIYLYYNPVNQSYKVSDIEIIRMNDAISASLKKYYALSLCTEVILKSFGGGESVREMFFLFLDVLGAMETLREEDAEQAVIQFLMRFLIITGHQPDLGRCSDCGKIFSQSAEIFYNKGMAGFSCADCRGGHAQTIFPGMIKYMDATSRVAFTNALGYRLEAKSEEILRQVLVNIVEAHLETRLLSAEKGDDIV